MRSILAAVFMIALFSTATVHPAFAGPTDVDCCGSGGGGGGGGKP
jgi:hypothetical protein